MCRFCDMRCFLTFSCLTSCVAASASGAPRQTDLARSHLQKASRARSGFYLICMGRRPMGSYCVSGEGTHRDHEILSARPAAFLDQQSRLRGFTQQRCLRQRHGADRAPARAARNGCAASKTRLTTCEAQTAMASSHRAASWIEGQCSPTDVDVGTVPAWQVC